MSERFHLRAIALCLILGLLSAPLVALAASSPSSAMPCCASDGEGDVQPCASQGESCPSMVPMPCCEAQPAAPVTPASGSAHAKLVHALALFSDLEQIVPRAGSRDRFASVELVARASPVHLSVILRV
jgi:hypothetical protein